MGCGWAFGGAYKGKYGYLGMRVRNRNWEVHGAPQKKWESYMAGVEGMLKDETPQIACANALHLGSVAAVVGGRDGAV